MSLPEAALRVMRLGWIVAAVVSFLVLAGVDIALRLALDATPPTPPVLVAIVVGACIAGFGWWWGGRVYRAWRIDLDTERLRVDHGVVVSRTAFVPRTRIQHVSTEQGPIQRALGLTSLTVHTAGARTPNVEIPHLEIATAESLRQELVGRG